MPLGARIAPAAAALGDMYDGIYRQKLSTDYHAHVAMDIYLYLMNIYSYCGTLTSQVSGEEVTFVQLYHMHTAFNQNTWFQHPTSLYCTR
jgi:hypothetical protein